MAENKKHFIYFEHFTLLKPQNIIWTPFETPFQKKYHSDPFQKKIWRGFPLIFHFFRMAQNKMHVINFEHWLPFKKKLDSSAFCYNIYSQLVFNSQSPLGHRENDCILKVTTY